MVTLRLSGLQIPLLVVSLGLTVAIFLFFQQSKALAAFVTDGSVHAFYKAMREERESEFGKNIPVIADPSREEAAKHKLDQLGGLLTLGKEGWSSLTCDKDRKLRNLTIKTAIGNLQFYVFDSAKADNSVTKFALTGNIFEKTEIEQFLAVSQGMPLIDLGANVGLVSLQAAMQGREVLSVEAIPENAQHLCRSAVDFGHGHLIHIVNNAVSSQEGDVTLTEDCANCSTRFMVREAREGFRSNTVHAITVDRLLEVCPFRKAALKIDIESHEGHAMHAAHRLFQQVDIPYVWMEWEHVKKLKEFGGPSIIDFMRGHRMQPNDLMNGAALRDSDYLKWPFSVLWVKQY